MQNLVVVTGALGRVGRALQAIWGNEVAGIPVLWSARWPSQGIDLAWNIGIDPAPLLPKAAIFLHLAGQTRGNSADLAENRRSAQILCDAAQLSDAAHVFFMSSVAVYRPAAGLIDETQAPDPISDYGRAKLAAEDAVRAHSFGQTVLRLGNLAGADALILAANRGPVVLDPVADTSGGPERSYIGPRALADVLAGLIAKAAAGQPLPALMNLALHPALPMADLLTALGADWRFGPPRPEAVARVAVSVERLAGVIDLPKASARAVVADLASMKGLWP